MLSPSVTDVVLDDSQQLHRTIPATTLSALVASLCFQASITSGLIRSQKLSQTTIKEIQQASSSSSAGDASDLLRAVTVGQPAGLSSASVQRDGNGFPKAIVMLRTARQIMQGQVLVPSDCVPHSNSL